MRQFHNTQPTNFNQWIVIPAVSYTHLKPELNRITYIIYNLVLWLIPVCILCARAYYVLFEWEQYLSLIHI